MPLPIGAAVAVRALGNKRGEVVAIGRDGRYQVRIEAVTTWCREEELTIPEEPRKKKAKARLGHEALHMPEDDRPAARPGRVDLHGLVVEEALGRVVEEIDRSLLRGADRVEIVHGKGSGRIREAVHRHLATMSVVSTFRLDPRNPGVTWVHFR